MVDATVRLLDRGRLEYDRNFRIEADTVATHSVPDPDLIRDEVPVWNLLIEHPEGTILYDTGVHHDALEGHWPPELVEGFYPLDADEHRLDEDLQRAGYALDDIDYVIQSHLHVDHAGGLEQFAGTDVPVFVHEAELKHAYYSATTDAGGGGYLAADFDHDLHWRVVHRDRTQFFEDVELLHLPGHTPGLLGLVIHLDDHGTLLFTGDQAELAANYERGTPMSTTFLWSERDWRESRRLLKDLERRHDATVVFGHDGEQFRDLAPGWGV